MRRLKQTGMALTLLGGAYCYGQMFEASIESFGTQYEKQVVSSNSTEEQAALSDKSRQLSSEAASYLVGSFSLLAAGGYIGLKLRDETIANRQLDFANELQSLAQESKMQADAMFDTNRLIMNGISEYDFAVKARLPSSEPVRKTATAEG